MKQANAVEAFLNGRRVAVLEYRSFAVEQTKPKDNQKKPQPYGVYKCLSGDDSVEVIDWGKRGATLADFKQPSVKRGAKLIVEFKQWEDGKFGNRITPKDSDSITVLEL